MATAWPTFTTDNILSGEGAETTGRALFDIQSNIKGRGSTFYFADWSATGTTYGTAATMEMRCPSYLAESDTIQISVRMKTTTGKTATFQAVESTGTNGSEVTSTSTTYETKTSEITVPDGTWAGTVKTFYLKGKVTSGGTVYLTVDGFACNVRLPG